ncbi:MAG: hypothetical protein MMC33_005212 [Icmadophila ericetorum]|nr:hypothetical protein [Icmadophila ericetorum]
MTIKSKYLTGDTKGIEEFIDKFNVFLFDCDGVLWSGDTLFEGTVETLEMLRSKGTRTPTSTNSTRTSFTEWLTLLYSTPGKQLVFVTNNSTKSRADYRKKLEGMGVPATVEEVFNSSYSASIYISRLLPLPANKRTVFVLGETGIEQELRAENLHYIGGTDPSYRRDITPADYVSIADGSALDSTVGVVLCGLDFHLTYLKLALAYHYIQRGAHFLATNSDSTLPSAGTLFPGAGACWVPLVKMLRGREPEVFGKPSARMMDAIEGKFEISKRGGKERVCMVGDRLDTDMRFGIEGGLGGTLMVLTGVSRKEDFEGEGAEVVPMAYLDKLGDLVGK